MIARIAKHKVVVIAILMFSATVLLFFRHSSILQTAHDIAPSDITASEPVISQNQTSTLGPSSLLITDKVAAIIETRFLNNLIPLILHFAAVLGPTWPVILYTVPELTESVKTSPALVRMGHQIQVRPLPEGTDFPTHESVSRFLTRPWFWDDLAPAEHVLLFQADSIICSNAQQSVEDFLEYDFIGAPIRDIYGRGYNGGFSIRNRRKVLEIVTEFDWEAERSSPNRNTFFSIDYEDQWMVMKISESLHPRLPTQEVAQTFAVETIYYDKPWATTRLRGGGRIPCLRFKRGVPKSAWPLRRLFTEIWIETAHTDIKHSMEGLGCQKLRLVDVSVFLGLKLT